MPDTVLRAVGASECLDVEVRGVQIVLAPVRIERGDAVRATLAAPGQGEEAFCRQLLGD